VFFRSCFCCNIIIIIVVFSLYFFKVFNDPIEVAFIAFLFIEMTNCDGLTTVAYHQKN